MSPETTNAALKRLEPLVGEWEMTSSVGGVTIEGRGRTSFEWLEGGSFLIQHADVEFTSSTPPEWVANSPFPVITVFGLDDTSETYFMLYADARSVYRVYQMTLDDGLWKIWRDAPGFSQRFEGVFSDDSRTISSFWEKSSDGSHWERDFESIYTKLS